MEDLPSEIRATIASFLDQQSRRIMRLANTEWHHRIRYDDFTFNFTTEEQFPQIIQRLKKYTNPIGLTFNKSKYSLSPKDYEEIGTLIHLTKLDISNINRVKWEEGSFERVFSLHESDKLGDFPRKFTPNVMRHLINLKRISIDSTLTLDILDLNRFSKLEVVHWNSPNFDPNYPINIRAVPHTNHVTFLAVEGIPSSQLVDVDLTWYSAIQQLALSTHVTSRENEIDLPHLPNLEYMILEATKIGPGLALNSEKLTALGITCDHVQNSTLAALTNLQHMSVNFTMKDASLDDLHFLTALTNLEYLKIELPVNGNDCTEVLQFIPAEKLSEMEINGELRLNHITKFSNLNSLEMYDLLPNPCTVAELQILTKLTRLEFSGVEPQHFPAIEKMKKLKSLCLSVASDEEENPSCEKFHVEKLVALENFRFYEAKNRELIDGDALQNLQLKILTVGWQTTEERLIENIVKLTTLETLRFMKRSPLTDDNFIGLTRLTNLTTLEISETDLTGVNLTLLTSLQTLQMRKPEKMRISNHILKDSMPRLYYCNLFSNDRVY